MQFAAYAMACEIHARSRPRTFAQRPALHVVEGVVGHQPLRLDAVGGAEGEAALRGSRRSPRIASLGGRRAGKGDAVQRCRLPVGVFREPGVPRARVALCPRWLESGDFALIGLAESADAYIQRGYTPCAPQRDTHAASDDSGCPSHRTRDPVSSVLVACAAQSSRFACKNRDGSGLLSGPCSSRSSRRRCSWTRTSPSQPSCRRWPASTSTQ